MADEDVITEGQMKALLVELAAQVAALEARLAALEALNDD